MIKLDGKELSFDYYLNALDCSANDVNELSALLRYRDNYMIEWNKSRALADINCIIDNMQELKEVINIIE